MKYCVRCGYPSNHPLGIVFDDEGVCSGCRVHEEKDRLDWAERRERLARIFDAYRSDSRQSYDCVIPVTGARDSYFIVHTVKKEFGMNPLLVSYNRHWNTSRGIRNLAYLRTKFDCDYVQMTIKPGTVQAIVRETLRRAGSIHWHVLAGQTVFPVQTAVRYKIPLIVWGAHQGIDQVGMYSHLDEVEMSRKYRFEHDLMGVEAEDLIGGIERLTARDLAPYRYPHDREIARVGVRGIYLNNYIRWDSKAQHERMIDAYAYETAPLARTFDTYNDVDCQHYASLHDWIKYLKWGYGKALDHAVREVRLKRMTREEAAARATSFVGVEPADKKRLLDWIRMLEWEFDLCIDRFRDPAIWQRDETGAWMLRDATDRHLDDPRIDKARLGVKEPCEFRVTPNKSPETDETEYQLHIRGYVGPPEKRVSTS